MTSLSALIGDVSARLARAQVPSPEADAHLLIAAVLDVSRGELQAQAIAGRDIGPDEVAAIEVRVLRRERREPLQHILGRAHFLDFEVAVGPGVFVPRPETEVLAQHAITHAQALAPGERGVHIVDLCSGSGVLAIALARAVPYADVSAVEISDDALPYLRENVSRMAPGVAVSHQSVRDFGEGASASSVDVIVANPPYVPEAETPNDPEVAEFDPPLALYGGEDGLDVVRDVVALSSRVLRPGGAVMIEHSNLHGEPVREILTTAGFRSVATERDLTGRDRFSVGFAP